MITEKQLAHAWLRSHGLDPNDFGVLTEKIDDYRNITYIYNIAFSQYFSGNEPISQKSYYSDFVMEDVGYADRVVITKDMRGKDAGAYYNKDFFYSDLVSPPKKEPPTTPSTTPPLQIDENDPWGYGDYISQDKPNPIDKNDPDYYSGD